MLKRRIFTKEEIDQLQVGDRVVRCDGREVVISEDHLNNRCDGRVFVFFRTNDIDGISFTTDSISLIESCDVHKVLTGNLAEVDNPKIKTKTVYQTEDGKTFDSRQEAEEHLAKAEVEQIYEDLFSSSFIESAFIYSGIIGKYRKIVLGAVAGDMHKLGYRKARNV